MPTMDMEIYIAEFERQNPDMLDLTENEKISRGTENFLKRQTKIERPKMKNIEGNELVRTEANIIIINENGDRKRLLLD